MIWVIDASVAVRWLLKEEEHPHADAVLQSVINYPNFLWFQNYLFRGFCVLCRLHLLLSKPILRNIAYYSKWDSKAADDRRPGQ